MSHDGPLDFEYSGEVRAALRDGLPIVALESTLIAHSFPQPERRMVAMQIEEAVRGTGATPATIAIFDGKVHIGLGNPELERISTEPAWKVSIDNLPLALVRGVVGATTVASSMFLAARAGISVFATGGLGGVHRGAAQSFDVSADLQVLGSESLLVVCGGVKSILDVPATLEVLETRGVTVVTLGTDAFPGFYVVDSGLTTASVDDVVDAAAALRRRRAVGLGGSVVVAVPPPAATSIAREEHDAAVADAEREATEAGVAGRDVTPIVLKRLSELTGGRSKEAGRQIILATAEIAARAAADLATGLR